MRLVTRHRYGRRATAVCAGCGKRVPLTLDHSMWKHTKPGKTADGFRVVCFATDYDHGSITERN